MGSSPPGPAIVRSSTLASGTVSGGKAVEPALTASRKAGIGNVRTPGHAGTAASSAASCVSIGMGSPARFECCKRHAPLRARWHLRRSELDHRENVPVVSGKHIVELNDQVLAKRSAGQDI